MARRERLRAQAPLPGKGMFITFEGVEGAGKTSRSSVLCSSLRSAGYLVASTREPGGTPVSERIREILLDPGLAPPPVCELMLFLAARAANVAMSVTPELRRGSVVIGDRFTDATLAYQAWGRGLSRSEVENACAFAASGLTPDLTFLLDLDPVRGLERLARAGRTMDRIEEAGIDFHRRVREGYLELSRENPGRIVVLDGELPPLTLDDEILRRVLQVLKEKNGGRVL